MCQLIRKKGSTRWCVQPIGPFGFFLYPVDVDVAAQAISAPIVILMLMTALAEGDCRLRLFQIGIVDVALAVAVGALWALVGLVGHMIINVHVA